MRSHRVPPKDIGERDPDYCYEHDAPIDDCPVCLAEIEWPAQVRTVQDVEHLASHQLAEFAEPTKTELEMRNLVKMFGPEAAGLMFILSKLDKYFRPVEAIPQDQL